MIEKGNYLSTLMLLVLFIYSGGLAEAANDCEAKSINNAEIESIIVELETLLVAMNISKFEERLNELRTRLPCSTEVLTRGNTARLHRVEAISAFGQRKLDLLQAHSRSAHAIEPDHPTGRDIFLAGHPFHLRVSIALESPDVPKIKLSRPLRGTLWVDGQETLDAPQDRPYVFQQTVGVEVTKSEMVKLGMRPKYSTLHSAWTPAGEFFPSQIKMQPELTLAAGATASLALGSVLISNWQASRFWDADTNPEELPALRRQVNAWSGTALGLGSVSVGLLIGAGVTGNW